VLPRVFAADLDSQTMRAELPADEGAHLTRVLRLRSGARVLVFDGRGTQYLAEVDQIGKRVVTVVLLEPSPASREPRIRLTLVQALLKGDKMDAVIRDATMLGIATICPVATTRTVVPISATEHGRVVDRWRRVAIASAKQCGRAVIPEIAAPRRFDTLHAADADASHSGAPHAGADDAGVLRIMLVEPSAAAETPHGELPTEPPARVEIAIGPEGGWTPEEVTAALAGGWHPWTLGERTLRAESAPLAALSVLTYIWKLFLASGA
jgi:16S rRNA (uracil1498-N3)-methyltransferase